jgi:hypothetical protein
MEKDVDVLGPWLRPLRGVHPQQGDPQPGPLASIR